MKDCGWGPSFLVWMNERTKSKKEEGEQHFNGLNPQSYLDWMPFIWFIYLFHYMLCIVFYAWVYSLRRFQANSISGSLPAISSELHSICWKSTEWQEHSPAYIIISGTINLNIFFIVIRCPDFNQLFWGYCC